jgi:hypothetical protein
MTARRWQIGLRRRRASSPEHARHTKAQMRRDIVRLVESAHPAAFAMQRHSDRDIGIREHVCAADAHSCRDWTGERSTPAIFQRVKDLAERACVRSDRATQGNGGISASASGAARGIDADRPPRCE